MDRGRGGSSPPSFGEVVVKKGKNPPESSKGSKMEGGKNREEDTEGNKKKENEGTKDKEKNDKK